FGSRFRRLTWCFLSRPWTAIPAITYLRWRTRAAAIQADEKLRPAIGVSRGRYGLSAPGSAWLELRSTATTARWNRTFATRNGSLLAPWNIRRRLLSNAPPKAILWLLP